MRLLALLLLPACLLAAAGSARADCAALDGRVRAAVAAGDPAPLPALADALLKDTSCDGTYVEEARRGIALALLFHGQDSDGAFEPEAVEAAARIARPWQVSMAFGDLVYGRRDFATAALAYEAAINEIRNVHLVPKEPPQAVEAYLVQRAYQAKSLAPTYVASRGFRGEPAGIIVPKLRGFGLVAVPVPIRFDTDEATLTADGETAVDDLYNFLKTQNAARVVLTGHTDERGTPRHNDALSLARAETVESALRRRGLDCIIATKGAGEQEPFAADDRGKYSTDDLYAFDRRVEFEVAPQ